jgi:hypothetical protein
MKPNAEVFEVLQQGARAVSEALSPLMRSAEKSLGHAPTPPADETLNLVSLSERTASKLGAVEKPVATGARRTEFTDEDIARLLGRGPIEPYSPPQISQGIPLLADDGYLPKGIHVTSWGELTDRFATNPQRVELSNHMLGALHDLKNNGFKDVYLGGSFATEKEIPKDFDLTFRTGPEGAYKLFGSLPLLRHAGVTKRAYGGDVLPDLDDYFQTFNRAKREIGILKLDLDTLPGAEPGHSVGMDYMNQYGGKHRFWRMLHGMSTEQPFPSIDGRFTEPKPPNPQVVEFFKQLGIKM